MRKTNRTPKPSRPQRAPGTYGKTFLREWRKKSNLTLEQAASRIGDRTGDGFSHSQLGRIERGEQPYSQPFLEAAAWVYGTDPASLLMRSPAKEDSIWSIWDSAKPEARSLIEKIASDIVRSGAPEKGK